MSPEIITALIAVPVVMAGAAYYVLGPRFVGGFKQGFRQSKLDRLARKQQKLTVERQRIKEKAKKIQQQREEMMK